MKVELLCAPTNRARQTGEHLRRGLLDNVGLYGRGRPDIGGCTTTAASATSRSPLPTAPVT